MILLREMNTQRRSSHVSPVDSEPEYLLRNSNAATVERRPINKADILARFVLARRVYDLGRDNLDVLADHFMDQHVEYEPRHDRIDEERNITENESLKASGYAGPIHNEARHMI